MKKVAVIGIVGNTAFMSVDNFHKAGETVKANSIHFEYGGKGFNQALACSRFGVQVSFLSAVGNQGYDDIIKLCERNGITPFLAKKDADSAYGCVLTDKNGGNRVTVYHGATLDCKDVLSFSEQIINADVLLINNEVDESVNELATKIAKDNGVKVIFNPAPERKTNKEILNNVYLFTPNEHEANGLEEYANVVQTLGDKGCYIKSTGTLIPAVKVNAVDTTGAGDTFNGVLASCIAEGLEIKKSVEYAVKASSLMVTRKGVVDAIPYKKEVFKGE